MSNSLDTIFKKIFVNLEEKAYKDSSLIFTPENMFINPHPIDKIDNKITNILKTSKYTIFNILHNIKVMFLSYNDDYYLFYPIDLNCFDFGDLVYEDEFVIGFGIIAISEDLLLPHEDISLLIYDTILASSTNSFDFNEISRFFKKYTIIKLTEINYKEDIYRYTGLLLADNLSNSSKILSPKIYDNLSKILNLESSRCIATCIIHCLDSQLLDHCFLEIYRCIEFLFYLQTAIDITNKYESKELYLIIDLVYDREIIHSERDSLYDIIKNVNDSFCINDFYDFLANNNYIEKSSSDAPNKHKIISGYIYDLRCKIAHLKYKYEQVDSNYDWITTIEFFTDMVYKIYLSLNEQILKICSDNNNWTNIKDI